MSKKPSGFELRSIRATLALWYAGGFVALAAIMASVLYFRLRAGLDEDYNRFLQTYASDLAANLLSRPAHSEAAIEAVRAELQHFRPVDVEYRVFDETDRIVFASPAWEMVPASATFEPISALELEGRRFRVQPSEIPLPDGTTWRAETAISLDHADEILENYVRTLFLVSAPLLAVSVLGGLLLARKSLRPVSAMVGTSRRITMRNLDERIPLRGTGDELDDLASAINEMLDRLAESFRRIEQFSGELAHELRTPLTRLIGETEAALTGTCGEGDLQELLARHAESYRSMADMVNDTLTLLRGGTVDHRGDMAEVRVCDLLEDVAESFAAVAEEKGVGLEFECGVDGTTVRWHGPSVRRAVSNLLDNAIRHTDKGTVRLDVGADGEDVVITVCDTGNGISADDLPRIFERFFRGPDARASGATGFGLGLSVVKHIAEEHGGSVAAESVEGRGTTFRVRIPRDSGAA